MHIKILRGTMHLGYAYRAGDTPTQVPDKTAKELINSGYAVPMELKKRPVKAVVKDTNIGRKKKVETTVIEK